MIRGSIEVAKRTNVAGWIHAEAGGVRDRLILAFAGGRCVGAGKVDRFRKDLLEAKLGDGYCGFDFPIKLNDDEKIGAVIVKLQNSDAALIQHSSVLAGPDDQAERTAAPQDSFMSPSRVSWLRDRGWLDQHEHDFLRAVHTVGAYERTLRPGRRTNAEPAPLLKPEQIAQDLFGLYALADVEITRSKIASISELASDARPLPAGTLPVMAFWATGRCHIALDEQSLAAQHGGRGVIGAMAAAGAIDYGIGPDRLLFVHQRASFAPRGVSPLDGVVVFTATEKGAGMKTAGVRKGQAA